MNMCREDHLNTTSSVDMETEDTCHTKRPDTNLKESNTDVVDQDTSTAAKSKDDIDQEASQTRTGDIGTVCSTQQLVPTWETTSPARGQVRCREEEEEEEEDSDMDCTYTSKRMRF